MTTDPLNDPAIRAAAEAWHELVDQVASCAETARAADPAKLPVTNDYLPARDLMYGAAESRILHEAHSAAERFAAAVDLSGLRETIKSEPGMDELALLGSVAMLRGALLQVREAVGQLDRTFPGEVRDPE
ncbi:hypothetical protein [Microbispora sp. NPDC049125]|uniref:hypothetical protein n=1 Tax=Microbispora sp. NPDC049125 TaxID=3154929 RepID=UPI003465AEB8